MTLLKREQVLSAVDLKTVDVEVPEWGGTVRLRAMTVAERGEFGRRSAGKDTADTGAWLVSLLAVDETGARMFRPEDVTALELKSPRALDRLTDAILDLNRVDEKSVAQAGKP